MAENKKKKFCTFPLISSTKTLQDRKHTPGVENTTWVSDCICFLGYSVEPIKGTDCVWDQQDGNVSSWVFSCHHEWKIGNSLKILTKTVAQSEEGSRILNAFRVSYFLPKASVLTTVAQRRLKGTKSGRQGESRKTLCLKTTDGERDIVVCFGNTTAPSFSHPLTTNANRASQQISIRAVS